MSFLETLNVRCINELALREKRVFLRTDFNFPTDLQGKVLDMDRLDRCVPTIRYAIDHNARLIIASHFGRPSGAKDVEYTLEPFAAKLAELLDMDIYFFEDCYGMGALQMVKDLKPGQILVLENLRFNEDEKKNSTAFARELAKMCDVYINDAFGVSHRRDASIVSLPKFVDTRGAGLSFKDEVEQLAGLVSLQRGDGFYAVIGGTRAEEKIGIIRPLLEIADKILLGGAIANLFLAAKGYALGGQNFDKEKLLLAENILKSAKARNVEIVLPADCVTAESVNSTETVVCDTDKVREGMRILDIGPKSLKLFESELKDCKTLFWSGSMGLYELERFAQGSAGLARLVAASGFRKIAGGGDTAFVIKKAGLAESFDMILTGGSAALEFLKNGGMLPGIEALK